MAKVCIILNSLYDREYPLFFNSEVQQDLSVVRDTLKDHQFLEINLPVKAGNMLIKKLIGFGIFNRLILKISNGETKLTKFNKNIQLIKTPRLLDKISIDIAIRTLESSRFLDWKVNHSNIANVKMLIGDKARIKISKFIMKYIILYIN